MNKKILLSLGIVVSSCSHQMLGKYSNMVPSPIPSKKMMNTQKSTSIDYIDRNRFRVHLGYSRVWDCVLDLMLKNYNLNIANKNTGLITTEWDSFYLNNKVYRNKLSIRVKKLNWNLVDIILYNNVEVLADSRESTGPMVWLPDNEGKHEIGRVVTNLSILLRLDRPNIPSEYIAKKTLKTSNNNRTDAR